ncbi:MAG TPA: RidA family protein [Dehalococcoidia bacterium]|nr:RidA family protein [Dehalococcoidia bacterium]
MKKRVMIIPGITRPDLPFNHVVRAGRFLFLTSQLSSDLKTGEIKSGTIVEQTRQALDNIKFLLEGCGATIDDIVKVVIYMRNLKDFDKVNEVYCEYFTKGDEPARVAMQAISPLDGVDIEIEVIAFK